MLDLSKEKVEGERGEEGVERWNNLGLSLVLIRSLGLGGAELIGTAAFGGAGEAAVLHRRIGLDTGVWDGTRGVDGLEKNPVNLEPFGSDLSLMIGESRSSSFGIDVQKALLHPNTISAKYVTTLFLEILILSFLTMVEKLMMMMMGLKDGLLNWIWYWRRQMRADEDAESITQE